ncbi:MAG: Gfo/Idh/MocA family protein [Brevefilum sp.]
MAIKIGILGCQSKHAEFFGSLFNVESAFPGFSVPFIFGDDEPSRLPYVCETAQINVTCQSADELINRSDAVLITYRLAELHFEPAMACIQHGKPVFVDKPFTLGIGQAQTLANASLARGVPLIGGSTLCYDPQLPAINKSARSAPFGVIAYRVQPNSPFGGFRFYGSHLTDLCSTIFGAGAIDSRAIKFDESVNVVINYPNRTVILHSHPDFEKPEVTFSEGLRLNTINLDDMNCYQYGMSAFVRAIQSHQPDRVKLRQLLFSTRLLNSIVESLETGEIIDLTQ